MFAIWQAVVGLSVLASLNEDLPAFAGDWIIPFWEGLGVAAPYLLTLGGLVGAGILSLSLLDSLHRRRDASREVLAALDRVRSLAGTTRQETKEEVQPTPVPPPAPLADRESVAQFRIYQSFCKTLVQSAIDFLHAGICSQEATKDAGYAEQEVAFLVRQYVLPECSSVNGGLDQSIQDIRGDITEAQFRDLQVQAERLMRTIYPRLLERIRSSGIAILGEDSPGRERFRRSDGYELLYQEHQDFIVEAKRFHKRPDWGRIVPSPNELARFMREPWGRAENAPVTMGLREIMLRVENGRRDDFLGSDWVGWVTVLSAQLPQEGAGPLALLGEQGGSKVQAEIDRGSLRHELRAGVRALIDGTIADLKQGLMVLSEGSVRVVKE